MISLHHTEPPQHTNGGGRKWRRPLFVAALLVCALVAWLLVWNTTTQPRAAYDSLWYARFAFLYAGAPEPAANAMAWQLFERYADPAFIAYMEERNGWPWQGFDDPTRDRWVGIYQMRPVMPLLGAAAYPVLGIDAPLAVSLLAVVIVVVSAGIGLAPLAGGLAASIVVLLTLLNPHAGGWLVHLTTDGLGMALWFAVLAASSQYVASGHRGSLAGVAVIVLVLAFTRQTAIIALLTFAIAAIIAWLARKEVWHRFARLTAATIPPLLAFAAFTALAGLPTVADLLQDVPTTHFSRPDIAEPIGFMIETNVRLAPLIAQGLVANPVLPAIAVLALLGFVVRRRWWALPWLVAIGTVPLLQVAHPTMTELPRTMAPIWFSVHLGLAFLVAAAVEAAERRRRRHAVAAA